VSALPDPPLTGAARALVLAECDSIARALSARTRVHDAIHEARKAIRRLRAFLALVAPRLPGVDEADRVLERLGDDLSPLRDAHVAVQTATRLGARLGKRAWAPAVRRLRARRDDMLREALARDAGFQRRVERVQQVALLLGESDWAALRAKDLGRGLEASHRRAASAKRRAKRRATRTDLHRWRRRLRKLRMQLEAVASLAPGVAARAAKVSAADDSKALHKLTDALGERLDLEVLRDLLRTMPDFPGREARIAELAEAAG
jgi:CHAD domain-containing protein